MFVFLSRSIYAIQCSISKVQTASLCERIQNSNFLSERKPFPVFNFTANYLFLEFLEERGVHVTTFGQVTISKAFCVAKEILLLFHCPSVASVCIYVCAWWGRGGACIQSEVEGCHGGGRKQRIKRIFFGGRLSVKLGGVFSWKRIVVFASRESSLGSQCWSFMQAQALSLIRTSSRCLLARSRKKSHFSNPHSMQVCFYSFFKCLITYPDFS